MTREWEALSMHWEAIAERRRKLLEDSDARVNRLADKVNELEAQLATANARAEATIEQCNEHFDKWKAETKKAEADAARLRTTMEAIANEKNWDLLDFIWLGDEPLIEMAQATLRPEQPAESEE